MLSKRSDVLDRLRRDRQPWWLIAFVVVMCLGRSANADTPGADTFRPEDVFELEYADSPRVSPDGQTIAYERTSFDIMTDRSRSQLWLIRPDGKEHRALTGRDASESQARWSPTGDRLLFVSTVGVGEASASQLFVHWLATGKTTSLTQLRKSPFSPRWSPDGRSIVFAMFVPQETKPWIELPEAPKGAEWAEPATVTEQLIYRHDGSGYAKPGHVHYFIIPAEGGTPRQLTTGAFDHRSAPQWTPDSRALIFSANRHDDPDMEPDDSELYRLDLDDLQITALTHRLGPDESPALSPDGNTIAFLGHDEHWQGYQISHLYTMPVTGGEPRPLAPDLDRAIQDLAWSADGRFLYFDGDDHGERKLGRVDHQGHVEVLATGLGGTSLGRPYASGTYSLSRAGLVAYTGGSATRPADLYTLTRDGHTTRITQLNEDLLAHKRLGTIEELLCKSSHDGLEIQGWILRPPHFDAAKRYPLILEIHGGPFANYGPRFSAEMQLYAAAGYVVVYGNPRGSTSYGERFGNAIHHAYPGHDYEDLMSIVDAAIARGSIDPKRLFVTGGSGGGVLTAWIVGKTQRFRAAVVAKPVINWYSFALTADAYNVFYKYWFPGLPWEHLEHYMARSPITYVGNVETPTMLMTGDEDHRTPSSEAEQFYQALKLRRVPAVLVRIPGASHSIASRPSRLLTKVAYILAWFERYDPARKDSPARASGSR